MKRIQHGGARRGWFRQSPPRVARAAARATATPTVRLESLEGRRLMTVVLSLQDANTLIAVDSSDPRTILGTV